MRDPTGSNSRKERTWQPGIAENAAAPRTYGATESTRKPQADLRPVDSVASAPSVQGAPSVDPRPAAPEPSVQPQTLSASESWQGVRTDPSSGSQALGAQPEQAIAYGSADRQLVRGEDTASQ